MKITQIHTNKPQSLSFEIFPPKKEEDFKNIDEMLEILCDLAQAAAQTITRLSRLRRKSRTSTMWSL